MHSNYVCLEFVYSKHELAFAEVLDYLFCFVLFLQNNY